MTNGEINKENLLQVCSDRIPEARKLFWLLPEQTSISEILDKLFDVTILMVNKRQFRVVKQCLAMADELLNKGEEQVRVAVTTIYMYRLSTVLYKKDVQAEFIYFLLPCGLRTLFYEHNYPDE
ncbi:DUF7674 family protein [Spirosoma pomorum]